MKFSYQARTKEGEVQTGFVEASSKEAASSLLQKYGLFITYLGEVKKPFWQERIGFLQRASKKDIIFFTHQLSIMLKSNIPVVESLETIARQTKKEDFRETILKISEDVEGGSSLSQALSSYSKVFSPFYVGMVRSGETSGKVPESLNYLADYMERRQDFNSKLVMGLIYPSFVLFVFFAVILVMGIVVIPKFLEVFEGMETELPFITKMVLKFSVLLKQWWPLVIIFLVSLVFAVILGMRSKEVKKMLDGFFLQIPLLGGLLKKFYLSRIALNLSTMISGGISISEALEITGNVVGNEAYKEVVLRTRDGVRSGKSISIILGAHKDIFPLFFTQMVVVGERTGNLEKTLNNVVDFYEKDVDRSLDAFLRFLEPAMIVFLGGLVAAVALSLYIPLFQKGLTI